MALVKCKECGGSVSTDAFACPSCGAKPLKKMGFIAKTFLALLGLAFFMALISPNKSQKQESADVSKATAVEIPTRSFTVDEKKAAIGKLAKDIDKVEEITWYRDKSASNYLNSNMFGVYMGQKNNSVWLRLQISTTSSDWIFFNKCIVKVDDATFEYSGLRPERHVGSGYVAEWIDVSLNKEYFRLVTAVANSKKATIRLTGDQFYRDRDITVKEKQAIKNVLEAYEALGGKMPPGGS